MRKTILEVIKEGYTGKEYKRNDESGKIFISVDGKLVIEYTEVKTVTSQRMVIMLDMEVEEIFPTFSFNKAFECYESGKEVKSLVTGCRYVKDGDKDKFISELFGDMYPSEVFSLDEIRGKWEIRGL